MANPFTREEALSIWARVVHGWANSLNADGGRTHMDGCRNWAEQGGSFEGVTRMMWGLGAWFSRPGRDGRIAWRGQTHDLAELTRAGLVAGTDPQSASYWSRTAGNGEWEQQTVESGQVAYALWQSRDVVWRKLTAGEQANIAAWLDRHGKRPQTWRNNWALFWLLNHSVRKQLGLPFDASLTQSVLDWLDGVYCGDGWYDDAATRGKQQFDDYNWWVFATHVLAWADVDGDSAPARRDELLARIRAGMEHFPYFFAAGGAYCEYGRSLAYKFARLGAALMAYRQGAWPHSTGMLRTLVGRHIRWYLDRGALRADGTLRQALTSGGSDDVIENYISTGATYWAMLAFAGLWALPDDDAFWTADEEPLPVERGSFVRVLPQPGVVLVGDRASGHVLRFNAGSTHEEYGGEPAYSYAAKYDKFVYSSLLPFNVDPVDGLPGPDAMLCLTDGRLHSHRLGNRKFAVGQTGSAGWLRFVHVHKLGGHEHTVDTCIVARGRTHVRLHRIALGADVAAPVGAFEGPAALGFGPGEPMRIKSDLHAGSERAEAGGRVVEIRAITGYDGQLPAAAFGGQDRVNVVHAHTVTPLLTVGELQPVHELVCQVYLGYANSSGDLAEKVGMARWNGDVAHVAFEDGLTVEVRPA